MDRKVKINDEDLPDVESQRDSTQIKKREHRWNLLKAAALFCILYSSLHKVLVPLFLKMTSLSSSSYSIIDYSFVLGWVLAVQLIKKTSFNQWTALMCGALVAVGIVEVLNVLTHNYPGWLSISHLVASVPLAIVCLFLVSVQKEKAVLFPSWMGALLIFIFYLSFNHFFGTAQPIEKKFSVAPPQNTKIFETPSPELKNCGAQELWIESSSPFTETDEIKINNCGLSPSLLRLTPHSSTLKITNDTSRPVNIHLWKGWNILIPPRTRLESPTLPSFQKRPHMLYSDTSPEFGIAALTNAPILKDKWILKRSPLNLTKGAVP